MSVRSGTAIPSVEVRDAGSMLGMSPRSVVARATLGPRESKKRPPKAAVEANGGFRSAYEAL